MNIADTVVDYTKKCVYKKRGTVRFVNEIITHNCSSYVPRAHKKKNMTINLQPRFRQHLYWDKFDIHIASPKWYSIKYHLVAVYEDPNTSTTLTNNHLNHPSALFICDTGSTKILTPPQL